MTGIEKLRVLARRKNFLEPAEARELDAIADQIEREIQASNEGEKVKCDHAADVSMSAYDLLSQEDRDAIAWVRDHGGLDAVKAHWRGYVPASWLEKAKRSYERKRDSLKAHAWELERKCAERRETIRELNKTIAELRPRLMPEGMEWPRFEDGEPVRVGDSAPFGTDGVMEVAGVEINRFGYVLHGSIDDGMRECVDGDDHGVAVKRPAPKVLDADGAEIRVGDTVWPKYPDSDPRNAVESAEVVYVHRLGRVDVQAKYATGMSFRQQVDAKQLTHRAPVLAADGKPLREGETVWAIDDGIQYEVRRAKVSEDGRILVKPDYSPYDEHIDPALLTHERPDTRSQVIDGMDKETVERIDSLVRNGRWLDD